VFLVITKSKESWINVRGVSIVHVKEKFRTQRMGEKFQILTGVPVKGWSFRIIRQISGFHHEVN
jgi:hypothetical protein